MASLFLALFNWKETLMKWHFWLRVVMVLGFVMMVVALVVSFTNSAKVSPERAQEIAAIKRKLQEASPGDFFRFRDQDRRLALIKHVGPSGYIVYHQAASYDGDIYVASLAPAVSEVVRREDPNWCDVAIEYVRQEAGIDDKNQ